MTQTATSPSPSWYDNPHGTDQPTSPEGSGPHSYGKGSSAPGGGSRRRRGVGPAIAFGTAGLLLLGGVSATGAVLVGRELTADPPPAAAAADVTRAPAATPLLATDAVDWRAVADAVQQSVVSISVTTRAGGGQGSGVVYDDAGHIVTNDHVVSAVAQGGTIEVNLFDGRVLSATVVGLDPASDLAVLQLDDPPAALVPAVLGDSSAVSVGDPVMAVGNPLGLSGTVTTGIVSALDRPVTAGASGGQGGQGQSTGLPLITAAIQTDAAVNPGNSGGALVDAAGQVVGINSAIASLGGLGGQAGSIGLGFAIPSLEVRAVAEQLIATGSAEHARMGVQLDDTVAAGPDGDRAAAAVVEVASGLPGDDAGLQPGDAVIAVDGRGVTSALTMTAIVRSYQPGDTVTLTVLRDGNETTVDVTLVAADEQAS